jgi:hypothetical protein
MGCGCSDLGVPCNCSKHSITGIPPGYTSKDDTQQLSRLQSITDFRPDCSPNRRLVRRTLHQETFFPDLGGLQRVSSITDPSSPTFQADGPLTPTAQGGIQIPLIKPRLPAVGAALGRPINIGRLARVGGGDRIGRPVIGTGPVGAVVGDDVTVLSAAPCDCEGGDWCSFPFDCCPFVTDTIEVISKHDVVRGARMPGKELPPKYVAGTDVGNIFRADVDMYLKCVNSPYRCPPARVGIIQLCSDNHTRAELHVLRCSYKRCATLYFDWRIDSEPRFNTPLTDLFTFPHLDGGSRSHLPNDVIIIPPGDHKIIGTEDQPEMTWVWLLPNGA